MAKPKKRKPIPRYEFLRACPLAECTRCGGQFRQMDRREWYDFCPDCRLECAEYATRPGGMDAYEYMQHRVGYRLIRGGTLQAMGDGGRDE